MPYKSLVDRKKYSKQYYDKNRKKILRQKNKYRIKNIERFKEKDKKYYKENKNSRDKYQRNWKKSNKMRVNKKRNFNRALCMKSWEGFLPKVTTCQICGRKIFFNKRPSIPSNAIHFDHRLDGKEPIRTHPGSWLRAHKRTPENEKIWKDCNFGMLCRKCNGFLFTKNRKQKLLNIMKYVFGDTWKPV